MERLTGNTPDTSISELLLFDFYDPVWCINPKDGFPKGKKSLGRFLGVAPNVGNDMCFWVLVATGTVRARLSVYPISDDEMMK